MRTTTSPAKITLEMHNYTFTWEGPWDSSFEDLHKAFVGLCSAATFGDISDLYASIYQKLDDDRDLYISEIK